MDSIKAFAKAEANKNSPIKVFDWNKAARLIKKRKPKVVRAGLSQDWEWTGGEIYRDGKPVYEYTYLASCWATPEIEIDGDIQPCWIYLKDSDNWSENTKWPESSLDILKN